MKKIGDYSWLTNFDNNLELIFTICLAYQKLPIKVEFHLFMNSSTAVHMNMHGLALIKQSK